MVLDACKSALFGVAVGDALGVPVEFLSREELKQNPVVDMRGFGTYNQPVGTWSDDSSLTFCLAEALATGYSLDLVGRYFVEWYHEKYWTPHGKVFDVGIATLEAIGKMSAGISPLFSGGTDTYSNGNGSLMRILPLVFHTADKGIAERFEITRQVSAITHAHIRSVIACFYYLEFARLILEGREQFDIYNQLQLELPAFFSSLNIEKKELAEFKMLLSGDIYRLPKALINSTGYVVHALEASIWCLLTTNSYKDAVLKAVNLGDDTDTTAAITGGLAGLLYGFEDIPTEWVESLARKNDIEALAEKLAERYES